MDTSDDAELYAAWVGLLDWMRQYADGHNVAFVKEADFPDFIYRMERAYQLPTTMMTASLSDIRGEPFLIANVSSRHLEHKHISLKVPGAHLHWTAEYVSGKGLLIDGKVLLSKERLAQLASRAQIISAA